MPKNSFTVIFLFLSLYWFSCNNPAASPAENTKVPEHASPDQPKENDTIIFVKAKFVEFKLADASHYIFEDEKGVVYDFGGNDASHEMFAAKLPVNKSNEQNQGWTSNKEMQGKWFDIKYKFKTQPQYTDGPMMQVPVMIEVKASE